MKNKILNNMLTSIMLAASMAMSFSSTAGLISDYTLNESTNIVTDSANNLEWLQWDETVGMSINSALAAYAADGWQLASNTQMADLFNTFLYYGFDWSANESSSRSHSTGSDGAEELINDSELVFVAMFGDTAQEWDDAYCEGHNCYQFAAALYGSDDDNDRLYKFAQVYDDYYIGSEWRAQAIMGVTSISGDGKSTFTYADSFGVALTRTTAVPEPSTITIFAMALLGLGAGRFRRG